MRNVTGSERLTAEHDDRTRPDTGPEREDIRGVADDVDDFEDKDEGDLKDEDEEDEDSF
jgi:hypothetical protein